jgi:ribosomal protein S27AE
MVNDTPKSLDRRSFLRGSALFAAAIGLSMAPNRAEAGTPRQSTQKPRPEEKPQEEEKPADPFADGEKPKDGKLYDKEGREYRVCPQCGYNMYKQGKMWVCENCGYSYVE